MDDYNPNVSTSHQVSTLRFEITKRQSETLSVKWKLCFDIWIRVKAKFGFISSTLKDSFDANGKVRL